MRPRCAALASLRRLFSPHRTARSKVAPLIEPVLRGALGHAESSREVVESIADLFATDRVDRGLVAVEGSDEGLQRRWSIVAPPHGSTGSLPGCGCGLPEAWVLIRPLAEWIGAVFLDPCRRTRPAKLKSRHSGQALLDHLFSLLREAVERHVLQVRQLLRQRKLLGIEHIGVVDQQLLK